MPPGEVVTVGGPIRKDVAGYDLIAAAGRLRGHPRRRHGRVASPAAGARGGAARGRPSTGAAARAARRSRRCSAAACSPPRSSTSTPGALAAAAAAFPRPVPGEAGFAVIAEADGSAGRGGATAAASWSRCSASGALAVEALRDAGRGRGALALARRRLDRGQRAAWGQGERGHRGAARPARGGDRGDGRDRRPARPRGLQLGPRRRRQPALHVPRRPDRRATSCSARSDAAEDLFELAVRLGGSVSGEHGLGWTKRGPARPPVAAARARAARPRSSAPSTRRGS